MRIVHRKTHQGEQQTTGQHKHCLVAGQQVPRKRQRQEPYCGESRIAHCSAKSRQHPGKPASAQGLLYYQEQDRPHRSRCADSDECSPYEFCSHKRQIYAEAESNASLLAIAEALQYM